MAACGGGGGGGNSDTGTDTGTNASTDTPSGQTSPPINPPASMSVRLLADNQVRLQLIGTGTPARPVCIRQDAVTPSASDPCFSNPEALTLEQTQKITPSDTQRKTFNAWLLKADNTVTRHASLSVPGRTCSTAAYASLVAAKTQLPAVCMLTATGTGDLRESVVLLEPVKAPISANNFLRYVNQGFYDQTVFHRFLRSGANVVQGGGFSHNGSNYVEKAANQQAIPLESTLRSGLSNTAGTIAMARTSEPDSATAGFFVNTTANLGFDSTNVRNGYAVFGQFIYGVASWGDLLGSVPAGNEVINPTSTVRLHWAYQIQ